MMEYKNLLDQSTNKNKELESIITRLQGQVSSSSSSNGVVVVEVV